MLVAGIRPSVIPIFWLHLSICMLKGKYVLKLSQAGKSRHFVDVLPPSFALFMNHKTIIVIVLPLNMSISLDDSDKLL